jgi:hypothetical protein
MKTQRPDDGGLFNSKVLTREYFTDREIEIKEWGRGRLNFFLFFEFFFQYLFSRF